MPNNQINLTACVTTAPRRQVIWGVMRKLIENQMDGNETLINSLLISVLGLIVIGGVVWFGYTITRVSRKDSEFSGCPMWNELLCYWAKNRPYKYDDLPRIAHDSYTEYLQRRNEFWTAHGQVLLAILIVIVLAILLITKTITAEVGLPILSGISGFAIAKGVSAAKSSGLPQPRRPNEQLTRGPIQLIPKSSLTESQRVHFKFM